MLLDAPSMYFRAFFAIPVTVTGTDGVPVNAVRGFLDVLGRQIRDHRPDCLVACMDADWRPAWRVAALPSYKAHRVAPDGGDGSPAELAVQVPLIEAVLDAVGIARCGAAGFEADDVIGTLTERHPGPVDVVSGDRDLFQLVRDDKPVRVLYGAQRWTPVDEASVTERYAIPGRCYGEFAVLRGDPSDGLPGVAGVGAKTAAALITKFGTVEAMLAALDRGEAGGFPAGARLKLAEARPYLAAAVHVVRVARDVPIPHLDDRLPTEPADPVALVALSDRHRLDGPLNRLLAALSQVSTTP
jgi:5'-3' exonuclease